MKQSALLLFLYSSLGIYAQCSIFPLFSEHSEQFQPEKFIEFSSINFSPENSEKISNKFKKHNFNESPIDESTLFELQFPKAPLMTTSTSNLEVCEGNATTLTAVSDYPIEWYTNFPPEGEPVGRGSVFVTPFLKTGYYIYHAVANNKGLRSNSSEMEVVMVYPLPFVNIMNSANNLCAGETVSLSAFGTRYYSWNTGEKANEIIIHPNQTTNYQVTGINTAGCKTTRDYTQIVENCIPVNDFFKYNTKEGNKDKDYNGKTISSKIFPNPNTGEFQLKINSISEFTKIEVFNSYGELVFKTNALEELTTIHLCNAPKGIYTLRILEQNALIKQEKVIIEK